MFEMAAWIGGEYPSPQAYEIQPRRSFQIQILKFELVWSAMSDLHTRRDLLGNV